ncbi:MAG: hypothetical protein WCV62_04950 [Candidatus Peribacteraceae bacterium]|jgi:predicted metal-dependent hydrolase
MYPLDADFSQAAFTLHRMRYPDDLIDAQDFKETARRAERLFCNVDPVRTDLRMQAFQDLLAAQEHWDPEAQDAYQRVEVIRDTLHELARAVAERN